MLWIVILFFFPVKMYQRGDGVEVDKEKALFYRTKAKKLQETTPTFN